MGSGGVISHTNVCLQSSRRSCISRQNSPKKRLSNVHGMYVMIPKYILVVSRGLEARLPIYQNHMSRSYVQQIFL